MFIRYLGLEVRVKMMTLAPRVLFPRGLCFSVMGGWWLLVVGGLFSMQPTVTAFPRFGAAWVSGRPSLRLSHLKRGSGPRSREAGLQFRNWKNLGATGHLESSHTEGSASHCQCVPSPAGFPWRGSSSGPVLGMGSRPTQPSECTLPPLCSEKAAAGAV